jgi:hypothetical protein
VEVVKSEEKVDLSDLTTVIDTKNPSLVAYRFRGGLVPSGSATSKDCVVFLVHRS